MPTSDSLFNPTAPTFVHPASARQNSPYAGPSGYAGGALTTERTADGAEILDLTRDDDAGGWPTISRP